MSSVPSPPRTSNITGVPDLHGIERAFDIVCNQTAIPRRHLERETSAVQSLRWGKRLAKKRGGESSVASLLWLIVVVLVVLWLIGLVAGIAGGFIHLLLVIALVVILYNLLVGRRAA